MLNRQDIRFAKDLYGGREVVRFLLGERNLRFRHRKHVGKQKGIKAFNFDFLCVDVDELQELGVDC